MSTAFSGMRLPGPPLATMEGQGCGAVGGGGPEVGLSGPLRVGSSTLCGSHSFAELFSFVHQGESFPGGDEALIAKGAVELVPSSPGFYSRLFVVQKASGSWRPVIDLSSLNGFVQLTPFRMESNQSVLQYIRSFNWMISINLKDAYL